MFLTYVWTWFLNTFSSLSSEQLLDSVICQCWFRKWCSKCPWHLTTVRNELLLPKLIAFPPQCVQLLHCRDYLRLLWKMLLCYCCSAKTKRLVWGKCRQICHHYVLIELIGSASDLQQNQKTSRCRRIQMSDEVMSLSRCSETTALRFLFL